MLTIRPWEFFYAFLLSADIFQNQLFENKEYHLSVKHIGSISGDGSTVAQLLNAWPQTSANSLDIMSGLIWTLKGFFKNINFDKKAVDDKIMHNDPACKFLSIKESWYELLLLSGIFVINYQISGDNLENDIVLDITNCLSKTDIIYRHKFGRILISIWILPATNTRGAIIKFNP